MKVEITDSFKGEWSRLSEGLSGAPRLASAWRMS